MGMGRSAVRLTPIQGKIVAAHLVYSTTNRSTRAKRIGI